MQAFANVGKVGHGKPLPSCDFRAGLEQFIQDVAVNADDAAITAAIIGMAKSLRLKVITEGVETEAQMSFLRTHQCDEIQGYYFGKPLSPEEGADKLRSSAVHTLPASQGT